MWWFLTAAIAADPALSGTWAIATPPAELAQTHERTLEEGLAALPWAFRPFARGPLTGTIRNCPTLTLTLTQAAFHVQCPAHGVDDTVARQTGPRRILGSDGKPYTVTLDVVSNGVDLTWESEDGGKRFEYRLDAGVLRQRQVVFSDRLPQPLTWDAEYRPAR